MAKKIIPVENAAADAPQGENAASQVPESTSHGCAGVAEVPASPATGENMVAEVPATTKSPENPVAEVPASHNEGKSPVAEISATAAKPASIIPEHIDRILKVNSAYRELYIDSHGGTFTVKTPPALRGNATLYANPYHKRS